MSDEYEEMPANIDFSGSHRGLHSVPAGAKLFLPVAIEEYFSGKATQKGIDLAELVSDVLKRDIEINEALK